jgi:hypothetical protein
MDLPRFVEHMDVEHGLTRRHLLGLATVAGAGGLLARTAPPALARSRRASDPLRAESVRVALDAGAFPARAAAAHEWATSRVLRPRRRVELAGLVWREGDGPRRAQVRGRRRRGEWTRWMDLHRGADHAPDGERVRRSTEPVWLGASDELQIRVQGGLAGLHVHAVGVDGRAEPVARTAQTAAPFPITPRAAWGADTVPPRAAPEYGDVQMAFVHHTVTANAYASTDSAGIVLGIARYHRDANGWNDIGYNFLVDRFGQVFEGRAGGVGQAVIGAQAQGYNSHSTGVAVIGTYESVPVGDMTLGALAILIGWKLALHTFAPVGQLVLTSAGGSANRYRSGTPVTFERISGHRDGDTTSCPGSALYAQLPALRVAAQRVAPPPASSPPVPPVAQSTAATVSLRAATKRIRAGSKIYLSGRCSDDVDSVQVVMARAGGDLNFKFAHKITMRVVKGRYSGRVKLSKPGLYRFTTRSGGDARSKQVFVRAVRRTRANGGLAVD